MSLARKLGRAVGKVKRAASRAASRAGDDLCAVCLEKCKPKAERAAYVRESGDAPDMRHEASLHGVTDRELLALFGKPQSSGEWHLREVSTGDDVVIFSRRDGHWLGVKSKAAVQRFINYLSKRLRAYRGGVKDANKRIDDLNRRAKGDAKARFRYAIKVLGVILGEDPYELGAGLLEDKSPEETRLLRSIARGGYPSNGLLKHLGFNEKQIKKLNSL